MSGVPSRPRSPRAPLGALLSAAVLAAGCGFTLGGPRPDPVEEVRVEVDMPRVALLGDVGQPLEGPPVTLTVTGTPRGKVWVAEAHQGEGLSEVRLTLDLRSAELVLVGDPNLRAGVYLGAVRLTACWDPACAEHLPGSPIDLPYSVELRAPAP